MGRLFLFFTVALVSKPRSGHSPCNARFLDGLRALLDCLQTAKRSFTLQRGGQGEIAARFIESPNREAVIHLATFLPRQGGEIAARSPNREAVIHLATATPPYLTLPRAMSPNREAVIHLATTRKEGK